MNRSKLSMILHSKIRERLLNQEGKRNVLVLAKPEAISRWGCEQENQGREIDDAYLSPGCSTGCSTWRQEASQHLPYHPRFTCKSAFFESRRADSNRLPLLQLRVCGQWLLGVAHACKSHISKGLS